MWDLGHATSACGHEIPKLTIVTPQQSYTVGRKHEKTFGFDDLSLLIL